MNKMNFHGIPQIDYTTDGEDTLEVTKKYAGTYSDLDEFYKLFSGLISSDCWALTVNDEIIFNTYDENRSLRECLYDDMIRTTIINNPHSLFVNLFRSKKEKDPIVCIYYYKYDSLIDHITVKQSSFQNKHEFILKSYRAL